MTWRIAHYTDSVPVKLYQANIFLEEYQETLWGIFL